MTTPLGSITEKPIDSSFEFIIAFTEEVVALSPAVNRVLTPLAEDTSPPPRTDHATGIAGFVDRFASSPTPTVLRVRSTGVVATVSDIISQTITIITFVDVPQMAETVYSPAVAY